MPVSTELNVMIKNKTRIPFFDESNPGLILTTRFMCLSVLGVIRSHGMKSDYIRIENGKLINTYTDKSIYLENFYKIKIEKEEVTSSTKDFKIDPYKTAGTEVGVFLVGKKNEKYLLLPKFIISLQGWGEKDFQRFLKELSEITGYPLEEVQG